MKKESYLSARIVKKEQVNGKNISCFVSSLLISVGTVGALLNTSGNIYSHVIILYLSILTVCAALKLTKGTKAEHVVPILILCVLLLLCLMFPKQASDGLYSVINSFSAATERLTGHITLDIDSSGDKSAATFVAAMTAALFTTAICSLPGKKWVLFVMIIITSAGFALGFMRGTLWLLIIAAGMVIGFAGIDNKAGFVAGICAVLIFGAFSTAGYLAMRDADTSAFKNSIAKAMHETVYENGRVVSMPEGELHELPPLSQSSKTVLRVSMSKPQKLYLRGFIGGEYKDSAWRQTDNSVLSDNSDMFYWLHKDGFFPQTQISKAMGYDAARSEITIENTGACTKWQYMPYSLAENGQLLLLSDAGLYSAGDSYEEKYISGGLKEWFAAQKALSDKQQKSDTQTNDYLEDEQAYKKFVSANYLNIPNEAAAVLGSKIGKTKTKMTLYEIKQSIYNYLDNNIRYDEDIYTKNGDEDFLAYVMGKSCAGYSVHYATIAAMLFRYYGVPSRYVEGYIITKDDATDIEPGQAISVSDKQSHAWCEYYLDGVGFVPFEATPKYRDNEESEIEGTGNFEAADSTTYTVSHDEQKYSAQLKPSSQTRESYVFNGNVLLTIVLAILTAIIVVTLVRKLRFNRRMNRLTIKETNNSVATAAYFGYAVTLMEHCKMKTAYGSFELEKYISGWAQKAEKEICALNDKAMFSDDTVTDEERSEMMAFASEILKMCKHRWGTWKRFVYKFIKILY